MIQSNYIPWRGYFDFIDDCDLFIFYDDVKYTHKDWRNRNRIKTHAGVIWLSVPVIHNLETMIDNAAIDYSGRWIDKHARSLTLAYQKAPFFRDYAPLFLDILASKPRTVSQLNVTIIKWVMSILGIRTETKMSSAIGVTGDKFERPLAILKAIGATSYLSGPTARPYTDHARFREAGVGLEYKTYDYPEYPQLHGAFEMHVTVLDLLFNCGPESRRFLKSRRPNEPAEAPAVSVSRTDRRT